jgi:simple sugar transport system ATP-binding protein
VHEVCDRIIVLDRGRVALDAPTSTMSYAELTEFLMSLHGPALGTA